MKVFLKKNFMPLLIPIICSAIIFSWFYEGKLISNTSEEELSIYHPQKNAEDFFNFWYPPGFGQKNPFHMAKFPTFFTLGLIEQSGIPAFLRQALLLWFLMVAGVTAMYLLLRKSYALTQTISLIGAFFYLLNIFSMTQVWKRFLYHGMFAWAYLPLFIFLWIKWLDSKRKGWLFLFLLTSVFFAYAFSQPAFIITVWTPAGMFVLVKAWQSRLKIREVIDIFLNSLTGLALWCLVNIWWLFSMLTIGSSWTQQTSQTSQSDLSSLRAVSKSFPIWEVLLLRQGWYLNPENDFGNFYQNPIIIAISVLVLYFVILAVIKLREYPYRVFTLVLAFSGLFVSKGTNLPLGYIFFSILFSALPFSAAFRNSYEKFGIVWLLAYTVLFVLGFSKFLSFLKPNKRIFIGGSILFLILVLVFPFWSGGVFPQRHRLIVPKYYDDANNYLNQQSNDRLFHVPFLLELENLTYSWGFVGGDPSRHLFNRESITAPKKPLYYQISVLLPKLLNDKQFPKILGLLGVGDVVLHKDSVYPPLDLEEVTKEIENWVGIDYKKEIGELIVYSLSKQLTNQIIYAVISIVPVQTLEEGLKGVLSNNFDIKTQAFISGDNPGGLNTLTQIIPQVSFQKISNDHFMVEIKKAKGPFILVFNNTFENSWQAKIDNDIINKHFIVNGFANGWLFEKIGDYKVDVRLKVWPWD